MPRQEQVLKLPQGVMMNKMKLELLKVILVTMKQLLALPEEKRLEVIADLERAVETGDIRSLPEGIKIL
jgi:hypothetical protein